MKRKGMGLVLGVSLLVSTVQVGGASANPHNDEEVVLKDLPALNREVADSIKTVHEKELSNRTIVSLEKWFNRKTANTKKTLYENELSERTVIANENEGEEVTE